MSREEKLEELKCLVCVGDAPARQALVEIGRGIDKGLSLTFVSGQPNPVFAIGRWVRADGSGALAFLLALIHAVLFNAQVYDANFVAGETNGAYLIDPDTGDYFRDPDTGQPQVFDYASERIKSIDYTIGDIALDDSVSLEGKIYPTAFYLIREAMEDYSPEWCEGAAAVPAETVRDVARELTDARGSAVLLNRAASADEKQAVKILNLLLGNVSGSSDAGGEAAGGEAAEEIYAVSHMREGAAKARTTGKKNANDPIPRWREAIVSAKGETDLDGTSSRHAPQNASANDAALKTVMLVDYKKCIGCKECAQACNRGRKLPEGISLIDIFSEDGKNIPSACRQCDDAPCAKTCPTGAIKRDGNGVWILREKKCIGCKTCLLACPFDSMKFGGKLARASALKCDFCVRERQGAFCAAACPMDCIRIRKK